METVESLGTSAAVTLEVVAPEQAKAMLAVVEKEHLAEDATKSLQTSFAPFFAQAKSVIEKSRGITVTDASQTLEIALARECRLALRRIRVAADKTRVALKEDSVRRGRAIDGFNAILLDIVATEETRLDAQEKFIERKEAARKETIKALREDFLRPYGIDTSFMSLAEMPETVFGQLLENTRAGHEAKLEAARKAEEARIAAENERLKEQQRIREENERLRREAAEKEAALQAERDRVAKEKAAADAAQAEERRKAAEAAENARKQREFIEAKAERERQDAIEKQRQLVAAQEAELERVASEHKKQRERDEAERRRVQLEQERANTERVAAFERQAAADRAEREKIQSALKLAEEAKARQVAAEETARKKAAKAPDREKLLAWSSALSALQLPEVTSEDAKIVVQEIAKRRAAIAVFIGEQVSTL